MIDRLRYIAVSLMFMLCASQVIAASSSLAFSGGYSAGSVVGPAATAANGAFHTPATITAAGRAVTVPAVARFAANAGQFAVGAIRLNPTALIVGAVLPYLIGKGIEYANGNFELYESPELPSTSGVIYSGLCVYATGSCNSSGLSGITCTSRQDCVQKVWAARGSYKTATTQDDPYICAIPANVGWCVSVNPQTMGTSQVLGRIRTSNTNGEVYATISSGNICSQPGYTLVSGKCALTNPQNLPVPESKWNEVISAPVPDAVAQELSRSGVPMPVEAPTFEPVDEPLGAPRLDPITGRVVQDRVRISQPNPSTNPEIATVIPYTIDAGDVPGQTQEPTASPREISDFQFPSDYARQGEAKAASDKLGDRLLQESSPSADPEIPDGYTDLSGSFSGLLGWQLPSHQSQCPTGSFDAWDRTFVFDRHCQLAQDHVQALALVMIVVWTIAGLWIVLRA